MSSKNPSCKRRPSAITALPSLMCPKRRDKLSIIDVTCLWLAVTQLTLIIYSSIKNTERTEKKEIVDE
ncbi:hypothetical protein ACTXT7_013154 [Hymenolepis weldensis]